MPELPEVQVVINYLKKHILDQKIINVDVNLKKLIKNCTPLKFKEFLVNKKIIDIQRRGKYLIFLLSDKSCFVSHLRMEGKYFIQNNDNFTKHDHIIFKFSKFNLVYNDTRQFGTFYIYNNLDDALNSPSLKKLGYEPFSKEFNEQNLYNLTKKSSKNIKTFLLDQSYIAGIGNIYADEILFSCKIHPLSITKKLNKNQIDLIIKNTNRILLDSIKNNGTTIHSFKFNNESTGNYQNKLLIHSLKNKKCINCSTPIEKIKVNGRGTYICKHCQKKYI